MPKLTDWERKVREDLEGFARQVNSAPSMAVMAQMMAHERDPEHVPEVDPGLPGWQERLTPKARKILDVGEAIRAVIRAEEEEDLEALHRAMRPITDISDGLTVKMRWVYGKYGYVFSREVDPNEEERYPFLAMVPVDNLDTYLNRYNKIARLGVCHFCGKVYVKPKHGQKTRYCSDSCKLKAYRKRKAERGA